MTETYSVGDTVRVKAISAVGHVVAVSSGQKIKRWPIVVAVPGHGEMAYGIDELEKLPATTALTVPPFGMPFP